MLSSVVRLVRELRRLSKFGTAFFWGGGRGLGKCSALRSESDVFRLVSVLTIFSWTFLMAHSEAQFKVEVPKHNVSSQNIK